MSHNPTAITIRNTVKPTVTAVGGSIVTSPFFEYLTGYQRVIFDDAIIDFENYVNNLVIMPYNPDVTKISFDDLKCVGSLTIPQAQGGNAGMITSAVTVSFPQLLYINSYIHNSAFVKYEFPSLKYIGGNISTAIGAVGSNGLTTYDFPELLYIAGSFSHTNNMTTVTSINFPKLKKIYGSVNFTAATSCTTMSFPSLTHVGGSMFFLNQSSLTSLNLSSLQYIGALSIVLTSLFTSINLSSLIYCTQISFSNTINLTTLSLPNLVYINNISSSVTPFSLSNCTNMSTISFPNLKSLGTIGGFSATGTALTQATVDHILVKIAAMDGTNGTTLFSSRSISLNGGTSATPSATGLAAKATLVARGCTVTTN